MALPNPIAPSRVDVGSPVDECLLSDIVANLQYLDGLLGGQRVSGIRWVANGELSEAIGVRCALDGVSTAAEFTPSKLVAHLRKSGSSGSIEVDIRSIKKVNNPITSISPVWDASTQSITRAAGSFNASDVASAIPAVSTQSIARAYSAISIESIVTFGTSNQVRYNLTSAPGLEWQIGDSFNVSGASSGGNNGNFIVTEINRDAYPSIVVVNPSGVQQIGAGGSAVLNAWAYQLVNPADSFAFVAGELAAFTGHTAGANNGNLTIFATNVGGNNIVVKNASGIAQGSAAGSIRTSRAVITAPASVSANFVVGERATFSGFVAPQNNGTFRIRAVNTPTVNTLVVDNVAHIVEAGASAPTVPNRWAYGYTSAPPSELIGTGVRFFSHTAGANNGNFTIVDISGNSLIVYNEAGVQQVSNAGVATAFRCVISFENPVDSAVAIGSLVEIDQTFQGAIDRNDFRDPWQVVDLNRSSGQNIVIDVPNVAGFAPAFGAMVEVQNTILSSPLILAASLIGNRPEQAISASTTGFDVSPVPADTFLGLFIKQNMGGEPLDLSVVLY